MKASKLLTSMLGQQAVECVMLGPPRFILVELNYALPKLWLSITSEPA